MHRRKFIKSSTVAAATLGVISTQPKNKTGMKNIFVHHVYFWLKDPGNSSDVKNFETALKELVSIESIHMYHLGKPADTRRVVIDSSYHYSLLVVFKNKKDHDIYQEHPKHDEFRKVNNQLSARVVVYDSIDIL